CTSATVSGRIHGGDGDRTDPYHAACAGGMSGSLLDESANTYRVSPEQCDQWLSPINLLFRRRLAAPDGGNLQVRCDGRELGPRAMVRIEAPMHSRKGSATATPRTLGTAPALDPSGSPGRSQGPGLPGAGSGLSQPMVN